MIDTRSRLVLKIIAGGGKDGGYKIVEVADIIMALPPKFRMDSEAVAHILTHLERQDMISIKYDDDGMYCLAVLPFGFEVLEEEKPAKKTKPSSKSFFLPFFGALLGGLIAGLVFFVFIKFL